MICWRRVVQDNSQLSVVVIKGGSVSVIELLANQEGRNLFIFLVASCARQEIEILVSTLELQIIRRPQSAVVPSILDCTPFLPQLAIDDCQKVSKRLLAFGVRNGGMQCPGEHACQSDSFIQGRQIG